MTVQLLTLTSSLQFTNQLYPNLTGLMGMMAAPKAKRTYKKKTVDPEPILEPVEEVEETEKIEEALVDEK